ncbi:MAG: twin-arginine translocase TatA/TatE family subunit [Nitrospirae bacterium]|nr:twin-arginine translocase TatA/TatE family subunit [Nitrospirota bacterium]
MFEGLFQPMHMLIILVIALIVFGPGKLPELGAGLGKSIREFKKALSDAEKQPMLDNKTTNNPAENKKAEEFPPANKSA